MNLQLKKPFEPLICGQYYKIVKEGSDYYQVSWRGRPVIAPKEYFFGRLDKKFEEPEEEFEVDNEW